MPIPSPTSINAAIAETERKEDFELAASFRKKSEEDPDHDWDLLSAIFHFTFSSSNVVEPFTALIVANGKRSMIPSDLSNEQLKELEVTFLEVQDSEYRARIGDILWLQTRNAVAAREAVNAYIQSGSRLENLETWPIAMERYERGLRLSRQVDRKGELSAQVLSHIESRIAFYEGRDSSYFSLNALKLLSEFKFGKFTKLASIAGSIADDAKAMSDFRRARSYLEIQAKFLKLAKNPDGAEAALVQSAELWVSEAEERDVAGAALAAHTFWESAIAAFKNRPSLRDQIPKLQIRLAAAGKKTLSEMNAFSHEMNIEVLVRATESEFRGLLLDDALCKLAIAVVPIDAGALRSGAIEEIAAHPLQSLFSSSTFDHDGRKISFRPSGSFGNPEGNESAIQGVMNRHAILERELSVAGRIAPAMRTILSDQNISSDEFGTLVENNQFIPKARLPLFIKGLESGFNWDFSTSLHILIPQTENSLRLILEAQGIVPRTVNSDGVETLWTLERVLLHPKTIEFLGNDLQYELRTLLIEQGGPNLRNGMAHGLLSADDFNGVNGFYLWWIIYRIIVFQSASFDAYIQRYERQSD